MLARVAGLRDAVLRIGYSPTDRPDDRLRKGALVLTAVLITILATVWTLTYLVLGRPLSAVVPFTYQVISVVSLIWFSRSHDFRPFALTQLTSMLLLPFLLQWTLGGFVESSAMMIWAFTAPLGAAVLLNLRAALLYFVAYLGLLLLSGLLDPLLASAVPPLPQPIPLLFFVLNISAVSLVVWAVIQYFVRERERALAETDALLHNILPMEIADRLKSGEQTIADDHAAVTVLFADVAGFTGFARESSADEVVSTLDRLFSAFDELADRCGMEKIKTIGDAYMAVAGAPRPMADHAAAAAEMALGMLDEGERVAGEAGHQLSLRIGMHSGPAMAGVIGRRKFAYDLWGDAVNVASRMESHGVPGRIQVSEAVERELDDRYRFEPRGMIEVKGLGEMQTYFLLGRR